ncbi:MAG: glycosyltransferase, partial [Cyclobacteriaceae bacterium]
LGVSDKITWLGELSREQVREEMQRCSFYVLPSRHETFGNVLLEAVACGKPVIATDCGGPRDIVTDEVGVLCEVDMDALTESLKQMISKYAEFTPTLKEDFTPDGFQSAMGNLYRVLPSRK